MIRILHIVHVLTNGGGLSNFIMNYYRNIDRTKIQFDFIYFKETEDDFKEEITSFGGRYFKFPEPTSGNFVTTREKFFAEYAHEYTAIHCHVLFAATFFADSAKKHGIKNVIAHAHSTEYGSGLVRKIRNWFFIESAKHKSDYALACSRKAGEFMFGKKMMSSGKVSVIPNAIDCSKYLFSDAYRTDIRKELGIENNFVIGNVGGFVPLKNHSFLIDVFKIVHDKNPDAVLLLAGGEGTTSDTKPQIIDKVKSLRLEDCVKFLGIRRDINKIMSSLDVFVLPSLFEGFGLVMLEAQLSGLPCIASSTVPLETKCTENAKYLELSKGANYWADEILKYGDTNNDRVIDITAFDSYNLDRQSHLLCDIYSKMQ